MIRSALGDFPLALFYFGDLPLPHPTSRGRDAFFPMVVALVERHIVDCGDLVDLAEAEVAAARTMQRFEALRVLRGLRAAERYWSPGLRLPRRYRHATTPFSAARYDVEQLVARPRRKGHRLRFVSSPPIAPR